MEVGRISLYPLSLAKKICAAGMLPIYSRYENRIRFSSAHESHRVQVRAHGASVTVATDIRGKSNRTVEPSTFTGCGLGATRSGASKLLQAFQSASWRRTAVASFAVAPRSAH